MADQPQPQSPFGARERAMYAALEEQYRAANPALVERLAPRVADGLRVALPDLPDVTIGRVALAVASYLAEAAKTEDGRLDSQAAIAIAGVSAAGLELTRTAREG